jgi:hypothetical protein
MGQIDHIFIHEYSAVSHETFIFILITPVDILEEKDDILGLRKILYRQEPVIVGINAIEATKPYIVPPWALRIVCLGRLAS